MSKNFHRNVQIAVEGGRAVEGSEMVALIVLQGDSSRSKKGVNVLRLETCHGLRTAAVDGAMAPRERRSGRMSILVDVEVKEYVSDTNRVVS